MGGDKNIIDIFLPLDDSSSTDCQFLCAAEIRGGRSVNSSVPSCRGESWILNHFPPRGFPNHSPMRIMTALTRVAHASRAACPSWQPHPEYAA